MRRRHPGMEMDGDRNVLCAIGIQDATLGVTYTRWLQAHIEYLGATSNQNLPMPRGKMETLDGGQEAQTWP